jgi:hypothetical protein
MHCGVVTPVNFYAGKCRMCGQRVADIDQRFNAFAYRETVKTRQQEEDTDGYVF